VTWFDKFRRQAAAAQKPTNKARALKFPGKGNRANWKKDK
jgi:hypothetical protein